MYIDWNIKRIYYRMIALHTECYRDLMVRNALAYGQVHLNKSSKYDKDTLLKFLLWISSCF